MYDGGSQTRVLSWWIASLAALFPAAIVALLVMDSAEAFDQILFSCAASWAAAGIASVRALAFWDWATRRFHVLSTSWIFTIAPIVGAGVGLVALVLVADPLKSALSFAAAVLGSLQGAAVVRLIVGPELEPPPKWQNDPEAVDQNVDDTPNPPKSAP